MNGKDLLEFLVNRKIIYLLKFSGYREDAERIKRTGDLDSRDVNLMTPLMKFVKLGRKDIVIVLSNAGAKHEAVDIYGNDSFMIAIKDKNQKMIDFLLDSCFVDNAAFGSQPFVNNRNHEGMTSANIASDEGLDFLSMLIGNKWRDWEDENSGPPF